MSATSSPGRTRRFLAGAGAACLTASLLPLTTSYAAAVPVTLVNDPPAGGTELVVFPQRDFVSATGFAEGETVTVEVEHTSLYGGHTISSTPHLVPTDDPSTPQFDGIVEVNHPGAYGWGPVTPDIRPGDKVRVVRDSGPQVGVAEQTTVADVTVRRPVQTAADTVVVHGRATDVAGTGPLPLDQLEVRLISPGNLFQLGGKRTLRTGVNRGATLGFDAAGSTAFTATFTGLSAADVTRALEAEAAGVWLGTVPATGNESTIYEVGAGVTPGPQGPGNGPLEQLPPPPGSETEPPSVPAGVTATLSGSNTVVLTWDASTDNVGVTTYGVYRDGVAIANVSRPDGAAPAPTTYSDKNLPAGDFTYTVDAADEIGNRSAQSGATAAVRTTVNPAANVPLHEPPADGVAMTVFPSRDFTEVDGVPDGQHATIELIRDGRVISTSENLIPTGGVVEVNHPGGSCWEGVTPEVRANDAVRATLIDAATGEPTSVHQIHVANVSAAKAINPAPGVVEIHGYAQGHDGKPLPLGELEARLVASTKNPFGKNGRRTLRAPEDGSLTYDETANPLGTKWTARFVDLDATDVQLALSVESRIMWLGRDPLAGLELTIYEAGGGDPPGPAAGFCSSPLEAPDELAPAFPAGSTVTATGTPTGGVEVTWPAAEDESYVYGYRVLRDGTPVANVAGLTFTDVDVPPGAHVYSVRAFDSASGLAGTGSASDRLATGQGTEYGNLSEAISANGSATDVTPPTAPGNLQVTNPTNTDPVSGVVTSTRTARLVWNPSTDNGVVAGYRVFRKDPGATTSTEVAEGAVSTTTTTTTAQPFTKNAQGKVVFVNRNLTAGATYTYSVEAYDGATPANTSPRSAEVPVVIAADTVAPAPVANVRAVAPNARVRDITVSWDATTDTTNGTDPGLVTAHRIFRDGTQVAQVNGTTLSFTDTDVPAGTHDYEVSALDSAGNVSVRTDQVAGTETVANDPPQGGRSITVFPARDIVEGTGYTAADGPVRAQVLRHVDGAWKVISTSTPATPNAAGLVEINHAGPDCWTTNTPDIRPGDIARIVTAKGARADQTVVQDMTVQRPAQTAADTVVVKGTAKGVDGSPMDASRIEHRIVSNGATFQKNGRRSILTPSDGSFTIDAAGEFTATYTGLTSGDVTRALNGETMVLWLGREALVGNELTITENHPGTDGGPAAGTVCTAPLEGNVPQAALDPTARQAFPDTAPGATSPARSVVLTNAGSAPMSVRSVYLAGANPGDFVLAPVTLPATLAPGASITVDVTFRPTAVGARAASVGFIDDAANTSYQTVLLSGNGVDAAAPSAPTAFVRSLVTDKPVPGPTAPVRLRWTASATGTVTSYQLQKSVSGGAFADVPAAEQPGTATTVDVQVATGSSTRYRLRALNGTNPSAWVGLAAFTLVPFQEGNASIVQKGTWSATQALQGAFGGSVRQSSTGGSTATLKTTAIGFSVLSTKGPDRGNAEVWLDGTRVATVSLYASSLQPAQVVFSREGLTNTTHQVQLRVLGTQPAGSTGRRIDLDGFLALR